MKSETQASATVPPLASASEDIQSLEQRLRTLEAKRQANRDAYVVAAGTGDVAKMRMLRADFEELVALIAALETKIKAEEEIRADLERVEFTNAQRRARVNAVNGVRRDLDRANKAWASVLAHLKAACLAYREVANCRGEALGHLRVVRDRRIFDDMDLAMGVGYSIEDLLRRMRCPTPDLNHWGSDLLTSDPQRWEENVTLVAGQLLHEIMNNHQAAVAVAERILPPEPPEAA